MDQYYAIIKSFLDYQIFQKYNDYLDYQFIKGNFPQLFRLLQTVRYLHREHVPTIYYVTDLRLTFKALYPQANEAEFNPLFEAIDLVEYQESSISAYLDLLRDRVRATKLATAALAFAEGRSSREDYETILTEVTPIPSAEDTTETDFINDDLESLYTTQIQRPGLRWRLKSLNEALGSLRKGNFGIVFARPETGKTTFLASELTHMAAQATGPVLWFNNEEVGEDVQLRIIQAYAGVDSPTLISQRTGINSRYRESLQGRLRVVAEANISKQRVEALCAKYRPSLIVFDQIDKLTGFSADRSDLELKAIYSWARELAKQYGPVIGVCQAGATAEGKRWLIMTDIDNSKTGKQGEADWILGIGCAADDGLETYRYLHLSKNKLRGDEDTLLTHRHAKWEVRIFPDIARYGDME